MKFKIFHMPFLFQTKVLLPFFSFIVYQNHFSCSFSPLSNVNITKSLILIIAYFSHAHLTTDRYNNLFELILICEYQLFFCFTIMTSYVCVCIWCFLFNSIFSERIEPCSFLPTMHLDPTCVPAMVLFFLHCFPFCQM